MAVLVGVANSKHSGIHDNTSPIISASDELRICADLCSVGLGGQPCGDFCFDLIPKQLPRQSINDSQDVSNNLSRSDACPVLCKNRLGYPLCQCSKKVKPTEHKPFSVNFKEICDYYCHGQRWWLRGCPFCEFSKQHGDQQQNGRQGKMTLGNIAARDGVDWEKWCEQQCAQNNGGSACNCDLLPFSLKI